jgi:hypothetical protein
MMDDGRSLVVQTEPQKNFLKLKKKMENIVTQNRLITHQLISIQINFGN